MQNAIAAKLALHLMLSSFVTTASIASIAVQTKELAKAKGAEIVNADVAIQISQTHEYLGLQIPLIYFLIACVVLAFIGALLSLRVDYVRQLEGSNASKVATALVMGLICTFVILPMAVSNPNVMWLMITAFFGTLAGAVLLHILFELMGDKELLDAVRDVIKEFIISRLKAIKAILGGGK